MGDDFQHSNGSNGLNGRHGWWQVWRNRHSEQDVDFSSYRRLAIQLHHSLPREAKVSRSVLIVTPNEPCLWANDCITLASCMAEELRRPVLLADIYNSDVRSILEGSDALGLADVLHNPEQPFEELAAQTSQPNLWFLSSGDIEGQPLTISTDNVKGVLDRAAKRWDFVILAGGPVLTRSSVLAMAPYVGCVLILAIENRTRLEDIDVAYAALQQCGAGNVSLVLTEPNESFG